MKKIKINKFLSLAFILFIFRIIISFKLYGSPIYFFSETSDTFFYYKTADKIEKNFLMVGLDYYLPILYCYIVAFFRYIFNNSSFIALIIFNNILYFASSLLFYSFFKKRNRNFALFVFLIFNAYSLGYFYPNLVLTETLAFFLNSLSIFYFLKEKTKKNIFIFGLITAVGSYVRITFAIINFLMLSLYFLVEKRKSKLSYKNLISSVVIFFIGFFLIYSPLIIRNLKVSKAKTLSTITGYKTLWYFNSKKSNLTLYDGILKEESNLIKNYNKRSGTNYSISNIPYNILKKIYINDLKDFIINDFSNYFLNKYLYKLYYMINEIEINNNYNFYIYKPFFMVFNFPFISTQIFLIFSIIAFFFIFTKDTSLFSIKYIYLFSILFYSFLASPLSRYRFAQIMPFAMFLSFYLFYELIEKIDVKNSKILKIAILFIAIFFLTRNYDNRIINDLEYEELKESFNKKNRIKKEFNDFKEVEMKLKPYLNVD